MRSADLLACTASVVFFLVLFGLVAFLRYLRHREIMKLAEEGLAYPLRRNGKDTLRWGIVIAAIGLALIIGLLPKGLSGEWELMLIGLLPTFFGLGLVLIYVLTREEEIKPEPEIEAEPMELIEE